MRKISVLVVLGLVIASLAIGGSSFAAQKKMRGFKMHPQQKPIAVDRVKASWAKLTKGDKNWKLYTVKDVSLMRGGMMKVMLQDDTGLDHELVLTQPQWLGMTEAFVETPKGVMVGAHEIGNEIVAFASPIRHW
jgi:hypothetical protein